MFSVTKIYRDFPAAHRQPKHKGHCAYIHGHNWGFDITFSCRTLDECGFVVDVGKLAGLKHELEAMFDHTLLLNTDDPLAKQIVSLCESGGHGASVGDVRFVDNCGMEGLAQTVHKLANDWLAQSDFALRGVICTQVVCWEDSKNSATFGPFKLA